MHDAPALAHAMVKLRPSEPAIVIGKLGSDSLGWIQGELSLLAQKGLLRQLKEAEGGAEPEVVVDGRRVILLSSNNYLGLATHPRVKAAAAAALERYGAGTGASRLISGSTPLHRELEEALARFKKSEAAVLFGSGYMANLGTIPALVGPGDALFCDKLDHASIIDAAFLSRARLYVYRHRDVDHLEFLLKRAEGRRKLVVTDTVFSMEGDLAPLPHLVELAERYGAMLMVDEAHATGVLGPTGAGAVEHFGLEGRVTVVMGTLSKALGSVGGYVAGEARLIELLRNRARPFIFDTAPPASAVAAALAALEIVKEEPQRRAHLLSMATKLREGLREQGYKVLEGPSAIVPVIVGEPEGAVALAEALLQAEVWAPAIRPPSVPRGTSRIRASVMATHTESHLRRALEAFAEVRSVLGGENA